MADVDAVDSDDESVLGAPWVLAGLTGGGVLLAGSLLLGLQQRRRAQFRARRPGRGIAAPTPEVASVETTVNAAGAKAAATVELMDAVLRRVASTAHAAGTPMPRWQPSSWALTGSPCTSAAPPSLRHRGRAPLTRPTAPRHRRRPRRPRPHPRLRRGALPAPGHHRREHRRQHLAAQLRRARHPHHHRRRRPRPRLRPTRHRPAGRQPVVARLDSSIGIAAEAAVSTRGSATTRPARPTPPSRPRSWWTRWLWSTAPPSRAPTSPPDAPGRSTTTCGRAGCCCWTRPSRHPPACRSW